MKQHDLTGLRADNLVAFMAALGTLRVSSKIWPDFNPQLSWMDNGGGWYAALRFGDTVPRNDLLTYLHDYLRAQDKAPAINLADDLTIRILDFHAVLEGAHVKASADERTEIDFLASFGSDAVESKQNGKPSGKIADTAFRTMSGAGHQHFLGTIRTLIHDTTQEHLESALFTRWSYNNPMKNHSLRWDPADDIRYALQWTEPSGDPKRSTSGCMWGAYRLAIEALPLFATVPKAGRLITPGFTEGRGDTQFTWPIWDRFINLDTAFSLVALSTLQPADLDYTNLERRGIRAVFRCRRITQGKFRNFTSGRPA